MHALVYIIFYYIHYIHPSRWLVSCLARSHPHPISMLDPPTLTRLILLPHSNGERTKEAQKGIGRIAKEREDNRFQRMVLLEFVSE
jgi:hypothetical protein